MQIHSQYAIDTYAGKKVSNHFGRDGYTSGTYATILTGITKIRDYGSNTASGCTAQGIYHHNQFHQVVIGRGTGGLDDENITTAYIFINLYAHFTITETTDGGVAQASVKAVGNTLC